jgi:hypothetical protein
MSKNRSASLLFILALAACGGTAPSAEPAAPPQAPPGVAGTAGTGPMLYAYSPDGNGLVASYPVDSAGTIKPSAILTGSKTRFVGGSGNLFGGAIALGINGTLYVFDAMRGQLLTFAGQKNGIASGNVAPSHVETLPQNSNVKLNIPQYAGFAQDTKGNFWTVDRSTGIIDRFPIGSGTVKTNATLNAQIASPHGMNAGTASTVADDGQGNIYCSCQDHDLALQLYGITEYNVTGSQPKLVRSFYGIFGDLNSQFPSTVLHVDPVTQTVYVGLYKPAFVAGYPIATPTGRAKPPRIIGGLRTKLDATVASITTNGKGVVYVAQGSDIIEFGPKASGNATPLRVISDPVNLQFLGYAYGNLLAIGAP